jgi:hypothetical protein
VWNSLFGLTELERPVFALLHQDVVTSLSALQPVLENADAVLTVTAPSSLAALALLSNSEAANKRGNALIRVMVSS